MVDTCLDFENARSDASFRFCFSLDTEPDDLWSDPTFLSFENATRLPEFHRALLEAGCKPTYLTTSEYAENKTGREAIDKCLNMGNCEVGAHFHTWTRSWPFDVGPGLKFGATIRHAMAHQLGREIEERMLSYTCTSLKQAFGLDATSYRGGRWSFGPTSVTSLMNCGIQVDSTVTPGLSWRDPRSETLDGPDFTDAPMRPFLLTPGNPLFPESTIGGDVLELPVGSGWYPRFIKQVNSRLPVRVAKKICSLFRYELGFAWLRPTLQSTSQLRHVLKFLRNSNCTVWVFMIHSSELVPCTKLPNESQVSEFINRCLRGVEMASDLGATPATLSEAANWIKTNDLA